MSVPEEEKTYEQRAEAFRQMPDDELLDRARLLVSEEVTASRLVEFLEESESITALVNELRQRGNAYYQARDIKTAQPFFDTARSIRENGSIFLIDGKAISAILRRVNFSVL